MYDNSILDLIVKIIFKLCNLNAKMRKKNLEVNLPYQISFRWRSPKGRRVDTFN